METGHLRLYMLINTPLGVKRVRLHTYYNIEPIEESNLTAHFRNTNPQLDKAPIQTEFCYRVERHI
jgi:subtilase family serine protease